MADNGPSLSDLFLQRSDLKLLAEQYAAENDNMLTLEESTSLEHSRKKVREEIGLLLKARKKIEEAENKARKKLQETNRDIKELIKSAKGGIPVAVVIEDCLRTFGINYVAYHGGRDLVGGDVSRLMRRGPEIFDCIKSALYDAAISHGNIEVEYLAYFGERCDFLGKLFLLCDGFFAILNKKIEQVTTDDKEKLQKLSVKMLECWRCLKEAVPPKVHATEDHIESQFTDLEGMGCYVEEFVEVAHQQKKKDLLPYALATMINKTK